MAVARPDRDPFCEKHRKVEEKAPSSLGPAPTVWTDAMHADLDAKKVHAHALYRAIATDDAAGIAAAPACAWTTSINVNKTGPRTDVTILAAESGHVGAMRRYYAVCPEHARENSSETWTNARRAGQTALLVVMETLDPELRKKREAWDDAKKKKDCIIS